MITRPNTSAIPTTPRGTAVVRVGDDRAGPGEHQCERREAFGAGAAGEPRATGHVRRRTGLRARTIAELACSCTRWVTRTSTSTRPASLSAARNWSSVSAPRDAAGPLLHVGAGGVVHIGIGDHVRHGESDRRVAGRGRPRPSTRRLSAARLITQLDITTSTDASGSGTSSRVALEELDVRHAGRGGVCPRRARASRRSCRGRSPVRRDPRAGPR